MNMIAYQITRTRDVPIRTQTKTLDEITRELPQGFYTTFTTRSKGTRVLGLHMHLQRLYAPAMDQGIDPSVDEPSLRRKVAELAKTNLPKESRMRLILEKNNGYIYIVIQPFEPHSRQIYENGVHVVTAELARQVPRVKDTGFISSSIEQRKRVGRDVFEVLLTKNGKILEGMTSNFYAIKGKTLVTARRGILLGVTRRVILRLARGQGMSVEYRSPNVHEKFDEAFLTSSSRGVVPIVSIDNKSVGQGRVGKWTKMLSKAYQAYVEDRSEKIVK
jgi:branched-chain amino acid aminotransferase